MSDVVVADWREIDTTADEGLRVLDRVIAGRLGYTVSARPSSFPNPFHELLDPNGKRVTYLNERGSDTLYREDYVDQEHEVWSILTPRFTTDTNEALKLPIPDDYALILKIVPQVGSVSPVAYCEIVKPNADKWIQESAPHNQPALAICKAWLAYTDSKNA